MSFYPRTGEKRRALEEVHFTDQDILSDSRLPRNSHMSPKQQLDQEKRMRREIANSNERRRMQSINAGFQSLKTLIPHTDGEKLSKAAILQSTSDYITYLEQEKTRVVSQNGHLKALLKELGHEVPYPDLPDSPPPKRKKRDTESSDEGISLSCNDGMEETVVDKLRRETMELRKELERERKRRMYLEEHGRHHELGCLRRLNEDCDDCHGQEKADGTNAVHSPMSPMSLVDETATPVAVSAKSSPQTHYHHHHHPSAALFNSYVSRRNLETIVEAIRHLEGESVLLDRKSSENSSTRIPHSEESETESSGEAEDFKSDSSGRDSPSPLCRPETSVSVMDKVHGQQQRDSYHHSLLPHNLHGSRLEKYPIATQLLHPTAVTPHLLVRPEVIVQKS